VSDGLDTPPSAPESWETARREARYSVDSEVLVPAGIGDTEEED
jgi:hypothetical protein